MDLNLIQVVAEFTIFTFFLLFGSTSYTSAVSCLKFNQNKLIMYLRMCGSYAQTWVRTQAIKNKTIKVTKGAFMQPAGRLARRTFTVNDLFNAHSLLNASYLIEAQVKVEFSVRRASPLNAPYLKGGVYRI